MASVAPAAGSPSRLRFGCALRARASWPVEGRPKLREDRRGARWAGQPRPAAVRPRVCNPGNARRFMRSGSDALGMEHGRGVEPRWSAGLVALRHGPNGSCSEIPLPHRHRRPIVQFTSLDSAGGPGGRGAGMIVAVVEPSRTAWVELAGRRVMPSPAPPMVRARAAGSRGGQLPVVCRGPATFTVRPIGAAVGRLTALGRRGVCSGDTRLSRRFSCLADREPRTQHPRAILIQPTSHPHRWPAAPLRRDGQGGSVVAANDTPRAGETAALTFLRRLGGIPADRCTGSHG